VADKATVAGGHSPTGTVTFSLYNNPNATGTPLFSDTETLVNGTATSKGYVVVAPGSDYWVATYNGDSNNIAVASASNAEAVTVTVTPTALCVLTGEYVEGSAKFKALPALQQVLIEALVTAACQPLNEIVGKLTAAQTAKLIAAYDSAANGLATAGWLIPSQATQLVSLAATL
jgi:hypothetical protein